MRPYRLARRRRSGNGGAIDSSNYRLLVENYLDFVGCEGFKILASTLGGRSNKQFTLVSADLPICAEFLEEIKPGRHGQLLFPSDQGSQYASDEFHQVLRQCGIKPSMSRKGNCWDNACAETLFASLKVERLHGRRFQTARQAKDETLDWLLWYNQKRLHSTLHYVSPMQFEQEWKCPVGSHPTLNECVQRTGYTKAGKPKTLSNFPTATTTTL